MKHLHRMSISVFLIAASLMTAAMTSCGGAVALQKSPLKLSLFGPLCPENTGSLMRLLPGTCYVSEDVAAQGVYREDAPWLEEKIAEIKKQEEV